MPALKCVPVRADDHHWIAVQNGHNNPFNCGPSYIVGVGSESRNTKAIFPTGYGYHGAYDATDAAHARARPPRSSERRCRQTPRMTTASSLGGAPMRTLSTHAPDAVETPTATTPTHKHHQQQRHCSEGQREQLRCQHPPPAHGWPGRHGPVRGGQSACVGACVRAFVADSLSLSAA
jgi:hypothetical protein